MKIVNTFLFSEPHEKDLLLIKFNLEKDVINEWVMLENAYTLQGDYKGLHAKEVIEGDSRFSEFKNRITIISGNELLHPNENVEDANFKREKWQRGLMYDYVTSHYGEGDWVIIGDADESVDFSDENRRNFVLNSLNHGPNYPIIRIGHIRYWYDFDNRCFIPNFKVHFVRADALKSHPELVRARDMQGPTFRSENPVAFEYSYCFNSSEEVFRKKCTYAHTHFDLESVLTGLECNHQPRTKARFDNGLDPGNKVGDFEYDFFEKVELTPQNSPKYVRDNFDWLSTNVVDPNYRENRKQRYGI